MHTEISGDILGVFSKFFFAMNPCIIFWTDFSRKVTELCLKGIAEGINEKVLEVIHEKN